MAGTLTGIALSLAMLGQASPASATAQNEIAQRFVCERSYVNFAWGYQHSGIFVDRDGTVFRFDVSTTGRPVPAHSADPTEAELDEKYGSNRTRVGSVPQGELRAMYQLIPAAAKGRLSEKVSASFDRGASASACYLFDAATRRYHEVELAVEGDWTYRNLAPEAEKLTRWLASLARVNVR